MTVVTRAATRLLVLVLALLGLLAAQGFGAGPAQAAPAPAYDSIPATLPGSWVSLGYQATSTGEFGDLIELAGTDRDLDSITVGFAAWACETSTTATCVTTPGATWTHPITVNVYAEGVAPLPGALLATVTQPVAVPYRPSADPVNCPGTTAWYDAGSAACFNGFAFTATFDFAPLVVNLPDRVIVTVAFNTQTHGAAPLGVAGPYNSLNVALIEKLPPTVGTDVDPDSMYWNTKHAAFYNDAGAGGTGFLRLDAGGWTDFGLVLEVTTYDPLATLPVAPGGGGAAGGLPTLAHSGVDADPGVVIAAVVAILLGGTLVSLGVLRRRRPAHRA